MSLTDERILYKRFHDIVSRTSDGECVVPECHEPNVRTMFCCKDCADRWKAAKGPPGTNDFRRWVVMQLIDAEDTYVRLRQEDP
jgi:hypothetical protein